MKKTLSLLVAFFCIVIMAKAQHSDYDKYASEIKTEIWGTKDADFENNTVPDQFKNESAVILAKRYDIEAKIKKHFRFMTNVGNKEIIFRYLLRQKVLIQDKSALGDFSEISYNKISSSSYGMLLGKQSDNLSTFIGAKVYKKDGSVKEVMMNEAVSVKDEKNEKDEKLAIPDLEVGDILDYYIVSLQKMEISTIDPMQFVLGGEYPILKFSLKGNIDKKYAIEYKCINGAPDLNISKDEDGDMQFKIRMSDLPKFPFIQWISPMRQAMLVRLKISLCGLSYSNCRAGEISKGVTEDEIYTNQKNKIKDVAFAYTKDLLGSSERDYVKDYVKLLKKSMGKEPPTDTLIYTIYNSIRYYWYYTMMGNKKIYPGKSRNETSISSNYFGVILSLCLKDYGIENELIFYSSRYMTKLEDLMSYDQPVFMVHIKGPKEYFLTDDGIFSQIGLIPGYAEGEKGVTMEYDNAKAIYRDKTKHMDQGTAKIPVSEASQNKVFETFHVILNLTPTPATTVERQITATGLMKEDLQKSMLLFEDYYSDAMKEHGEYKTFIQEYANEKRTRSFAEEWQNSFAKARESYKDGFMQDLKGDYNAEPKELTSYKISSSGVKLRSPEFSYSTTFVMQEWIKKAGNNYLFELGKVIGNQMQVKEEDRKRTIDIYQPFARSFEYVMHLDIPAGFSIEGVDALNKNVANECGSFTSTASLQGNQLIVHVQKEYNHNFEPVSNWPRLLEFIDASSDFSNKKILLKKK
jgi:hypothetical protein